MNRFTNTMASKASPGEEIRADCVESYYYLKMAEAAGVVSSKLTLPN
jgi:hypothetical protein